MAFFSLLPVLLSFLLLAAHCFRGGQLLFMALALLAPLLLLVRRSWVPRLLQAGLLLGALEWLHTGLVLALARRAEGLPFLRLALILGGVVLFTAASALVFLRPNLRTRYGLQPAAAKLPAGSR